MQLNEILFSSAHGSKWTISWRIRKFEKKNGFFGRYAILRRKSWHSDIILFKTLAHILLIVFGWQRVQRSPQRKYLCSCTCCIVVRSFFFPANTIQIVITVPIGVCYGHKHNSLSNINTHTHNAILILSHRRRRNRIQTFALITLTHHRQQCVYIAVPRAGAGLIINAPRAHPIGRVFG